MPAFLSIPPYPGAIQYDIAFSDPTSGNPNAPNPFGTWTTLVTATTTTSNIGDAGGNEILRLYRARPYLSINSTPVPLQWYGPFSSSTKLFDPQITNMIPAFRDFIGDYGMQAIASTDQSLDTGAGVGLLQPTGTQTIFSLAESPDTTPPVVMENSVIVVKNGSTLANMTDYSLDYDNGTITFAAAPQMTDAISITYKEVRYSNRMLCSALAVSVDSLAGFKINGYGLVDDNNLKTVNGTIGTTGLKAIIFAIGLKILNRAAIRLKSDQARDYRSGDFSFSSAPGRVIDGMSLQAAADAVDIKSMANKYIQTATIPTTRTEFDSFFDFSGRLPLFGPTVQAMVQAGYSAWL